MAFFAVGAVALFIIASLPTAIDIPAQFSGLLSPPVPNGTIPPYPGATVLKDTSKNLGLGVITRTVVLQTADSPTQALAFYDQALLGSGWRDITYQNKPNTRQYLGVDEPRYV